MENRDLKMAEKIAACVADKGGRTFLVGGYVRDLLRILILKSMVYSQKS